jgi:hypothetical protein
MHTQYRRGGGMLEAYKCLSDTAPFYRTQDLPGSIFGAEVGYPS